MAGAGTTVLDGSADDETRSGAAGRVAVVFERSDAGRAALREAAELVSAGRVLSVVTLAPQARPPSWGRAGGTGPYNIAIKQEAELELHEAREILGSVAGRATFEVLAGCPRPHLAAWVRERGFRLVLLPRRRFTPGGNPYAKSLRNDTSAEVRIVR